VVGSAPGVGDVTLVGSTDGDGGAVVGDGATEAVGVAETEGVGTGTGVPVPVGVADGVLETVGPGTAVADGVSPGVEQPGRVMVLESSVTAPF
jgi:hypothetical protein